MATFVSELWGLSAKEIARICQVDLATARRWKRGAFCPPYPARALLARDLGCFHPLWSGWTINDRGLLISPENWQATPGDVLSIQLTQMQLSTYRSENRVLKQALEGAAVAEFEEQPLPTQWNFQTG
jgi:hypothetical protein